MAKPKGMYLRGSTWWARKDVPKELTAILGKTSLKKTLGTSDQAIARVRFHAVMADFEARIETARKRLAGQPIPGVMFVPNDPRDPYLTTRMAFEAAKPENRIQAMLEEANLIKPKKAAIYLKEVFEQWVKERQPTPNTEAEYERARDIFIELNGNLPISEYNTGHARKWKAHVVGLRFNGKPVAHATKEKNFGAVTTLFRFADRNDYLTVSPFAKIVLERPKRAKVSQRQEWDRDELRKLFRSPVFKSGKRFTAGGGEAAYWLPVLALYHGFRAGELCQLDKADLVVREGIHCLHIHPSYEDDGEDKSVKTSESVRTVPLHKQVIDLGFLDYVKSVKGKKMFPKISPDSRGRWSGNYSKWFGRYRRSIGLDQRWTDFHSFRHTWKSAARGAKIPEDHHDEISGHDSVSVGRTYGRIPVKLLKRELDKVKFDITIPKWKPA